MRERIEEQIEALKTKRLEMERVMSALTVGLHQTEGALLALTRLLDEEGGDGEGLSEGVSAGSREPGGEEGPGGEERGASEAGPAEGI